MVNHHHQTLPQMYARRKKQIKTTVTSLTDNLTNLKLNKDNRAVVFLIGNIYSVLGVYDDSHLEHLNRATLDLQICDLFDKFSLQNSVLKKAETKLG